MSDPGHWRVRGPTALAPTSPASAELGADRAPTILVAGVVHHLAGLLHLGQIQRARWSDVVPGVALADLVVVGRALAGVDVVAVIAGLKDHPLSRGVPVLHAAPAEAPCAWCRADVCLSSGSTPGQLARVARVLLEPGQARARGSGGCAARGLESVASSRPGQVS